MRSSSLKKCEALKHTVVLLMNLHKGGDLKDAILVIICQNYCASFSSGDPKLSSEIFSVHEVISCIAKYVEVGVHIPVLNLKIFCNS